MKITSIYFMVFMSLAINSSAQKRENIPINMLFHGIKFTSEQDSLLREFYQKISEQAYPTLMANINWYAYTLLDSEQKSKFEEAEKREIERMVSTYFSNFELSLYQIEKVVLYYKSLDKRLLYGKKLNLLSSYIETMESLEQSAKREELTILNKRKYIIDTDNKFKLDAEKSITQFQNYRNNYYPKFVKISNRFKQSIDDVDKSLLEQIQNLYIKHVRELVDEKNKILINAENTIVAKNQFIMHHIEMKNFMHKPNLCIYWCPGKSIRNSADDEQKIVTDGLTYFVNNYTSLVNELNKKVSNLNEKIRQKKQSEEEKNLSQNTKRTTVTLIAPEGIKQLEKYAELILLTEDNN